MEYLNFDLEINTKTEGVYPVAASSNAGEARHLMRFPWEGEALDTALLRVENALLRAGQVRRGAGTLEEQVVQHFGQTLFEALLASDVRRLYDALAQRATQQGQGLRVRLRIQAPELATLPWEFLYDPLQHEYLCFLPGIVLVRYLEAAQPLPPFTITPPLRVLAMIADPSDQDRLDVVREQQRLRDALRPLEQRGLVKLRWVEGQTIQALQRALMQGRWHIWHYIGHGAFDPRIQEGVLALANEQESSHLLRATDLGRLLAQHASLRLVVLNSCQGAVGNRHDLFSSTAATLASKRIPAVLAMQYDISDQAALEFTRGFYEALAVGKPVDEALAHARTAISVGTPRTLEWVTPVLYLRAPTGLLFQVPPQVSAIIQLPQPQGTTQGGPGTEPVLPVGEPPAAPPGRAGAAPLARLPVATPVPPDRMPPRLSRRAVVAGLAGLALAGGGAAALAMVRQGFGTPNTTSTTQTTGPKTRVSPTVPPTPDLGTPRWLVYRQHLARVNSVDWSPDNQRIVSGSDDQTAHIWSVVTGNTSVFYRDHRGPVNAVSWSPDGIHIASAAETVKVWDDSGQQTINALPTGQQTLDWSPDGKRLVDGTLVWDLTTQQTVFGYRGALTSGTYAAAWSPDGTRIATGGGDFSNPNADDSVQVWNAFDGTPLYRYRGHTDVVTAVAWSPDSTRIASGSYDGTVRVWDAADGSHVFTYRGHLGRVFAVVWSLDNRIASGSVDGTVRVWDGPTGNDIFIYRGHVGGVYAVAWSSDSARIASGGFDRTVQVWQVP